MEDVDSRPAGDSGDVDLTGFMVGLGKQVLHPGGRTSTNAMLRLAPVNSGHHVLDIGCGVGATAVHIAATCGCRVTAVDADASLVEHARSNVLARRLSDRITIVHADAVDLPFFDDAFDRVLIQAVTMFTDRSAAAREVFRVCTPGGRVLDHEICLPRAVPASIRMILEDELFPGIHLDRLDDWIGLYRDAGFIDIDTEDFPLDMTSPGAILRDEGLNTLRILVRVLSNREQVPRLRRLIERIRNVEPHVRAFVVSGLKPSLRTAAA